jgi:uncharacterized cofD-like protein/HAD superfamily hydrolase (TIGR01549 family)
MSKNASKNIPNIVCIGGGTGQSEILRGLKKYECNITAIVAVTDSGRSTGVMRNNFNIIAPGDIRNCIAALSESENLITELFQYRFNKGVELEGMSFGNLFLTAMSKIKGDMFSAIKETSKILKIKGKVLPSTLDNTHICAELYDGKIVEQELNVRKTNKSKIKRIFLKDKDVKSPKEVISAIKNADLIVIGPGSLYTSVLVHFLISNLKKAFINSKAKKVYICNMVTQAGQTDNYTIYDHLDEITKYCGKIDYAIINNEKPNPKIMKEYEKEGGYLLDINKLNGEYKNIKIIFKDILKKEDKLIEWNKVSSIRHDPEKTTEVIMKLINKEKKLKAVILAAGNSTRLRPFSFSESKTMIKFLGKPLLEFHIEECINNGIKEIALVCNKENIKQIKEYFNSSKYKKYLKYFIQKEQNGTSDALISAKDFIKNSYILLKFGDSIAEKDETPKIISIFKNNKADLILTLREIENTQEFGIAKLKNNEVIEIVEKPKENPPSNLALVGFSIMNGDLFIKAYEKFNENKILPPQQYMLALNVKNSYWITDAKRLDVGRAWNLIEANKILIQRYGIKNTNIEIPKNSKISNECYISPNAIISDNVTIEGYSSVSGFVGEGSKIIDSFIMEGTRIGKNCLIETSVIGKNNNIGNKFITKTKTINGNSLKIYVKDRYVNPTIKKAGIFTGENVTIMDNITSEAGKMIYPNKIIKHDIKSDKLIRAILFDADNTLYNTKNVAKNADIQAMNLLKDELISINNLDNKEINKSNKIKKEEKINNKINKINKTNKINQINTIYETEIILTEIYDEWIKIVNKLKNSKNPKERTRQYSYEILINKYKLKYNINNNFYKKMYNVFLKKLTDEIKIMPNLNNVLELRSIYKMAVFTEDTSDLTLAKLKKLNIDNYFDLIITSDKIGEMKPSIEYYKEIFKRFDISPNECLVIGDNYEKDLKLAKELGATTIMYNNFDKRADYSIYNYNELISLLKTI